MKKYYQRKHFFPNKSVGYHLRICIAVTFLLILMLRVELVTAQWVRKSDALRKRAECPSILYQGKIYVFGGFGEHPNFEKDNEVYDPATDTWTLTASFPVGKEISHQEVVLVDDKIWHIGGRATNADGPVSSQVIIYDITNNVWIDGPQLKDPATRQPLTIGGGGAVLLGRTIHYIGGFAPTICVDQSKYHLTLDVDKWIANPQNTTWENKLAPMPTPRNHLSAVVFGGRMYALGGQFGHDCSGADQKYCHVYDPVNNTWTRLTDLPSARSHTEAATLPVDGKIYMVGGQGPSSVAQNTVLVFTPTDNNGLGSWATATQYQLPNNYYGISAKIIGSTFYISHGALTNVTNERMETYSTPFPRNIPYQLGFTAACFSKAVVTNQKLVLNNFLYTLESQTSYSLTSNATWLTITKNATGIVSTTGADIEATVDATGLAAGSYSGTITASGTGSPAFASGSFCVNIVVSATGYTLNVTATGNGTVTKNPDQNIYASNTVISLTANAGVGQYFKGWSGDTTGTGNPLGITMRSNKNITATFVQTPISFGLITDIISASGRSYTLAELTTGALPYTDRVYSITSVPSYLNNAAFIGSANDDKSSKVASILTFTLTLNATLYVAYDAGGTALPAWLNGFQKLPEQIAFNGTRNLNYMQLYSKDFAAGSVSLGGNLATPAAGAQNNYFVIAKSAQVVQYNLTVTSSGSGSVTKTPDQATYSSGANVSLMATPGAGQQFSGWSGAASGTTNPLTVTMDADKTITATFIPLAAQYNLNITTSGTGTVTKTPNQTSYASGASVDLMATPGAGQQFTGWSGTVNSTANPLTVIMDADKNITANFAAISPALFFNSNSLSFSVTQNGNVSNQIDSLYANTGNPAVTLTQSPNTSWLILPSPALGLLSFGINSAGLQPGTYNSSVTASANGYANTILQVTLIVNQIAPAKSIQFTQSGQTAEVEQGSSQSLLEYISTSDNVPASTQLSAVDEGGNVPNWLSVNGFVLNGINYTAGSEITFSFDATNLSIGTYSAVVTASAAGYNSAVLNIFLTVKAGTGGTLTTLKVNFQDSITIPPAGWVRDFGQAFGLRSSANQGSGYSYGWIKRSDNTPVDLTKNSRKRTTPSDMLLATLMQMQQTNAIEGKWEVQVVNGNYDVTVSVGDGTYVDSKHSINIEGVSAISNFVPTSSVKFKSATVTISVADGFLTVDATGGVNTKINYISILPSTSNRPSVVLVNPENSSQNVSENTSVSTSILRLPNGGINNATITTNNVYLTEQLTGVVVPSNVNGTGGGDAITLVPSASLKLATAYNFNVTSGVKDLSGASFIPYVSNFTTGSGSTGDIKNVKFDKIDLPNATGQHSSLTMGPDGKLYALSIDGLIKRFAINSNGTLATPDSLYALQDEYGTRQSTLAIGLAFDPSSTANNLIAWVTHSSFVFLNGPPWDGKLTKLSGNNLQTVQDVLINLPRSYKDHVTNSIAFGPDGALYFTQGSTSAMGRADNTWGNRNECLMSGAVLRLDLSKLGSLSLPLNVKTADGGGTYNPYAANAPLTIYASGVRNAYDLVWHSNGNLYVATNGSAAGGNTPASVNGTLRPDGSTYNGPVIPALTNVQQTQKDFLFRIVQGGYYGHPNPLRGEYVMNGGNPTTGIDPAQVDAYTLGTMPDVNWRGYAFDFQNNKSPDGSIEYKSNTFNGALKGKLLVVRYSQHDDIITLTPGGANNDIISSTEGNLIPGFSGFVDPLDLTEDVNTGNIYVSEYGGNGKIDLLRVNNTVDTTTTTVTLGPLADAYVRSGSYASQNYGLDTSVYAKSSVASGYTRLSYLKFPLNSINNVTSAKLRLYGRNADNTNTVNLSAYGVDNDSWTETGITFNNAPPAAGAALSSVGVNSQPAYYEFDVTGFVQAQLAGDKVAGFLVKDPVNSVITLRFNSKENAQNKPQLVIVSAPQGSRPLKPADPVQPVAQSNIKSVAAADNTALFSMKETLGSENNFEKPKVYPNPLHNKFNIEFPSNYQGTYNVQIIDVAGRKYQIAKTIIKPGGSAMEVNISKLQLKTGTYFLKIISDHKKNELIKLKIQ